MHEKAQFIIFHSNREKRSPISSHNGIAIQSEMAEGEK